MHTASETDPETTIPASAPSSDGAATTPPGSARAASSADSTPDSPQHAERSDSGSQGSSGKPAKKAQAKKGKAPSQRAPKAPAKAASKPAKKTAAAKATEPEPASDPAPKKKSSPKRSTSTSDAPWNPTVVLRWEGEEQPAWSGPLDELVATNGPGEGEDEWASDLRASLRKSGEHQGGGGAVPSYTVTVVEGEDASAHEPEVAPACDPDEVRARTLASLPKPPADPKPAKVTSATLLDAAKGFLAELEAEGASEATVSGYKRELKVALAHFGEATLLCSLTPRKVANYFECDAVMVARDGAPKAEPSYQRTRRVLRLALCWAVEQGMLEQAPIPAAR